MITPLVLRLIQMIQLTMHYLFGFASTFPNTADRSVWVEPLARRLFQMHTAHIATLLKDIHALDGKTGPLYLDAIEKG
ncbi:MAG: hypothetical protein ACR2QF_06300, partial [Geminicoccaceae bacterium]